MSELTHLQCDEFRRLPCSFDNMLRAVHKAGRASMKAEAAQIAVAAFGSATVRSDISTAILALED